MENSLSSNWSWFDYFSVHSNQTEEMLKLLVANSGPFKLDKAKSLLSIGPGFGNLDAGVIDACCGGLQHYIGVEPNKHFFDSLSTAMKELRGVKVTLVNDSVPEWTGPKDPVDIVLVSHVLYFIKDPVVAIQQFYKWLKPGGSVIFLHAYQFGLFRQIAEENGLTLPEAFSTPELKRTLDDEGFPKFEEIEFRIQLKVPSVDEGFVRGYFKAWLGEIAEDKMQGILQAFKEKCQGKEAVFEYKGACIKLTKPHNI